MIDFYTSWCGPCKKLDKEVYGSEDFYSYTQKIACVKVDFESESGALIGKKYDVSSFPTVVFVDANGNEIERLTSYYAKSRYMDDVDRIVEGKNTVGAMAARYPHRISYSELFHLSIYYGRKYFHKEKRDLYHEALIAIDPQMQKDSTLMLTNVIYQSALVRNDASDLDKAITYITNYPSKPYQAELLVRIVTYLDKSKQKERARMVYDAYVSKLGSDQSEELKRYLKEAKKIVY